MSAIEISKYDDVIDSRDVISRIEELADELESAKEDGETEAAEEILAELKPLQELAEEAKGYAADWKYGAALIRDSYFVDYAQELADDIVAVNSEIGWPNSCIDWEKAARELQMDYSMVTFDGVDYWTR